MQWTDNMFKENNKNNNKKTNIWHFNNIDWHRRQICTENISSYAILGACGLMFVFFLPLGSFRISSRKAGPARRNIRLEMVFFSVRVSSVEFVIASASISDISPSLLFFFSCFLEDTKKEEKSFVSIFKFRYFPIYLDWVFFYVSAWAVVVGLCFCAWPVDFVIDVAMIDERRMVWVVFWRVCPCLHLSWV